MTHKEPWHRASLMDMWKSNTCHQLAAHAALLHQKIHSGHCNKPAGEKHYFVSTSSLNKCISSFPVPGFTIFHGLPSVKTIHLYSNHCRGPWYHSIPPRVGWCGGSPALAPTFCNAGLSKKKFGDRHWCTKRIPVSSHALHLPTCLPSSNALAWQRLLIVLVPCTEFEDKQFFQG